MIQKRLCVFQRTFGSKINRQLPLKDASLKDHDPELFKLIEQEKAR
jgi:glycine hydroxymethyltransferase